MSDVNLPGGDVFVLEEEDIFARDIDGQLVRLVAATAEDYDKQVRLTIDGQPLSVRKAVPLTNSQGDIVRDAEGRTIPRATTIYDAASQLFVREPGDQNPIPTLCHSEHLRPAAVCRVCVVAVFRNLDGQRLGGRKLVPACHHRVEEGMEVHTIRSQADPEARQQVHSVVKTLAELLMADHLPAGAGQFAAGVPNELRLLMDELGISRTPFARRAADRPIDDSSYSILVDHNLCILCDRCIRACDEVKENHVIGRTGKGGDARIGFDLDIAMRDSTCVSCGECAVSCPTNALTFREEVVDQQVRRLAVSPGDEVIKPETLARHPLFSGIPYKFLQFNGGAVVRRRLKKGDVLCEEGEYGSTAFIIESGKFEVFLTAAQGHVRTEPARGFWGRLGRLSSFLVAAGSRPGSGQRRFIRNDGGAPLPPERRLFKTPEDVILGEMTCMNRHPRSATVVAAEDSQVLEIRRNVLYMLQRNAASRRILDRAYQERALRSHLEGIRLFEGLGDEDRRQCAEFLRDKVELVRVEPGQVVFRQGESADNFYMVRLGFVKVSQKYGADERVLDYLGPGTHFGEIGLLSAMSDLLTPHLPADAYRGIRTATCSALDHVELVRLSGRRFRDLVERFPSVRDALCRASVALLKRDREVQQTLDHPAKPFLEQGLYLANSLLVLDLESCTRCDECTRACADTHDGVTRLIREGLRFDKFLIASSCRSCMDPYCLIGCPVDAIHREGDSLEIRIEDHCIGCGLCASNCPYGNINMHGTAQPERDARTGRPIVQQKATTCDLCSNVPGRQPSCVYACPHDAAFRMSGRELFELVEGRGSKTRT